LNIQLALLPGSLLKTGYYCGRWAKVKGWKFIYPAFYFRKIIYKHVGIAQKYYENCSLRIRLKN